MKSVIILAAGVGSRLRPLTNNMPKSMVKIAGKALIQRLIEQIKTFSIDTKIIIVAGYQSEQLRQFLSQYDTNVEIIDNTDYLSTNNMESCRLGLDFAPIGDCIIVNADCIYDDKIVKDMLKQKHSCIAVDSSEYFEENMKVKVIDGSVKEISKTLQAKVGVLTSIDMYYFTEEHRNNLYKIMLSFNKSNDLNQWTEVAINEFVKEYSVGVKDFSGNRWVEIDDLKDLNNAESKFG
jgi:choline kinase